MSDTIAISLSASGDSARAEVDLGIARLRAVGLDIEWHQVREEPRVEGRLGGFEAGATVDGTLRLHDTPESAERKARAAGAAMGAAIARLAAEAER